MGVLVADGTTSGALVPEEFARIHVEGAGELAERRDMRILRHPGLYPVNGGDIDAEEPTTDSGKRMEEPGVEWWPDWGSQTWGF
jgi:hypothetical protein